jgi:2-phosphosulfolactate phosphatase
MCTTNGTRALLASLAAERVFAASLLNASATADALLSAGRDVLLVCAGTHGRVALEDVIGAGAVLDAMRRRAAVTCSDGAKLAQQAFVASLRDLPGVLRTTAGGQNVTNAGLSEDLRFLSRLDAIPVVAELREGLIIRNQTVV